MLRLLLIASLALLSMALASCQMRSRAVGHTGGESALTVGADVASSRVISVGEIHGTAEIPEAVGLLAGSLLRAGKSVVVGMEISSNEQSKIDAYLQSNGTAMDREKLLSGPFWNSTFHDGRSSKAMAQLIEQIRVMARAGHPVRVLAFDIGSIDALAGISHDAVMARNVARAIESYPNATFVLLSGNLHATKQETLPFDAEQRSMAFLLNKTHPVATFKADFVGGSAWVCQGRTPSGGADCRARPWEGYASVDGPAFIRFDDDWRGAGRLQFDGTFFVGKTVTASPPAVSP